MQLLAASCSAAGNFGGGDGQHEARMADVTPERNLKGVMRGARSTHKGAEQDQGFIAYLTVRLVEGFRDHQRVNRTQA